MKCHDCKRTIWFWQKRGIDNQSHINCHRRRCLALLKRNPQMADMIKQEMAEIEAVYERHP